MNPPSDRANSPDFESQVVALLREISSKLDRLDARLASTRGAAYSVPDDVELDKLSRDELDARLMQATKGGNPFAVLDIRRVLARQVNDADREQLDRQLASWFTHHFHESLRAGRAADVAGAIERAVEEIGNIPEMQLLAESLPTVLHSVGLLLDLEQERRTLDD